MARRQVLDIHRGDTLTLELLITKKSSSGTNEAVDLTGATIWMTAKRSKADADNAAVFQISTTGGSPAITIVTPQVGSDKGRATIIIPASATSGITDALPLFLDYDVQYKDGVGQVTTVTEGVLAVKADVTRAT